MEGYSGATWKVTFFTVLMVSLAKETEQWVHNTYVKLTQAVSDSFNLSDCWVCTVLPRGNLEFPVWGIPSMNWTLTFAQPRNGTCPFGKDGRERLGERFELLPRDNVNIYTRCLNDKTPCVGTGPLSYLAQKPDNCSMAEYVGTFNLTKIRDYGVGVTICADKKDTNSGSHGLNSLMQICKLQKGFYWLCGDGRARKSLPLNWKGHCIGGYLSPRGGIFTKAPPGIVRTLWRQTRTVPNNPLVMRPTGFPSFVRWLIPSLGISEIEKAIVNISATLEIIENTTADVLSTLQEEISSLHKVVLQNRMGLDMLLAKEGGLGTVINQTGCVHVNKQK